MDLMKVDIFFKNDSDIKDAQKLHLKQNGQWYSTEYLRYTDMLDFISVIGNYIKQNKIELLMSIKKDSNKESSFYFDIMSIIISNRFFIIHKYIEITPGGKITQYNFFDNNHVRKAKLVELSTNTKLDPEELWNSSWYVKSLYK